MESGPLGDYFSLIEQGGSTMAAILVMSILAVGVAFERYWTTRQYRRRLATAAARIVTHLREGKWTMAQAVNTSLPWQPGQALFDLLLDANRAASAGEIRRTQGRILRTARKRLWVLATIGATAPFVGLFGTVLGIMQAFRQIALVGGGGFQVVSAGISEALVTTAGGIFVGVEAVIFFNYLQVCVNEFTAELKEATEEIHETVVTVSAHGDTRTNAG